MKITIRCDHCGTNYKAESMGDNCICPVCHKFVISMSEYIRKQIFEKQEVE